MQSEKVKQNNELSIDDDVNRAYYLLEALDYFAKASSDGGYYETTLQNDRGNKFKIRKLHQSREENLHKGRISFLQAYNLDPYLDNNIETELLIARTVVMAEKFRETYTGPGSVDRRAYLRKQLFCQVEKLNNFDE